MVLEAVEQKIVCHISLCLHHLQLHLCLIDHQFPFSAHLHHLCSVNHLFDVHLTGFCDQS